MSGSAQGHIQGALQGSGNAPSGRVARRISIGVGPRSACGIIIIDIESWERLGGGGGGELVPDGQPCYSTCLVKCDFYTWQCVGWMVGGGGGGGHGRVQA